eukprot:9290627-Pyramimonas_sp.AAC.1
MPCAAFTAPPEQPDAARGPPPGVARFLKVKSCKATCQAGAGRGGQRSIESAGAEGKSISEQIILQCRCFEH